MLVSKVLGCACLVLLAASLAMDADFARIARFAGWGGLGAVLMVALIRVLGREIRPPASPQGNAAFALLAGMMLAPAVAIKDEGLWAFTPFPGMGFAMLEGSVRVLLGPPGLSILLSSAALYLVLRQRARSAPLA